MRFDAKRASRMLGILTFAFMLMFVMTTQSIMATSMNQESEMTVPDYIYSCWDGYGYANYPDGYSYLETTLEAVELLYKSVI